MPDPIIKVPNLPTTPNNNPVAGGGSETKQVTQPIASVPENLSAQTSEAVSTAIRDMQFSGPGGLANIVDETPVEHGSNYITSTGEIYNDPNRDMEASKAVSLGLIGIPLAFADTVGRSLNLWSDDSVKNYINDSGFTEFGSFYARNKQVLTTTADLVGMFIPGTLGMKALEGTRSLITAGKLGQTLKNSTAVSRILGNGEKLTQSLSTVREAALYKHANEGFLAGRDYGSSLVSVLKTAGEAGATTIGKAKSAAIMGQAAEGFRKGVAFELGVAAFMNDSDTLYPPENTTFDNLKWAALGPAVGAVGEYAAAKYAVRQVINGVAKGVNKNADPFNVSQAALDTMFRPGERGPGVTTYGVMKAGAKSEMAKTASQDLRNNLQAEISSYDSVLVKQFQAAGGDRNRILTKSFALNEQQARMLAGSAENKPTAYAGLWKLDDIPKAAPDEFQKTIDARLEKLQKQFTDEKLAAKLDSKELEALRAEHENLKKAQYFVIENNGEITPFSIRPQNWLDENSFKDIKARNAGKELGSVSEVKGGKYNRQIAVDRNFNIYVGKSPDIVGDIKDAKSFGWESATPQDRSVAFAIASRDIARWSPEKAKDIYLNENMPWFTLDAISSLMDKHDEAARFVRFSDSIPDRQTLDFLILDKKFADYKKTLRSNELAESLRKSGKGLSSADIAAQFNLPRDVAGQPHPLVEFFNHLIAQGDENLTLALSNPSAKEFFMRQGLQYDDISNIEKLQKAIGEVVTWPKVGLESANKNVKLTGTMFAQTDTKPVFMMAHPVPELSITSKSLIEKAQIERAKLLSDLTTASRDGGNLVEGISRSVIGSNTYREASKVEDLRNGVAAGQGIVTEQGRVLEQHPTTNALNQVVAATTHQVSKYIDDLVKPYEPTFAQVFASKNSTSLFEFNQIEHAYRYGWDLTGEVVEGKFVLADTAKNKTLWRKLADEHGWHTNILPIEEGAYLPNMARGALNEYRPLEVSQLAADTATAISQISRQAGMEANALRTRAGLNKIKLRDFHLPTPEINAKAKWVILNEQGKPINIYTGETVQEAEARASAALAQYAKENPGRKLTLRNWDEIERYNNVFSDNFQQFIDYSDPINQTGRAATGGLFRPEVAVGPDTLKNTIHTMTRSFHDVGARTRALVFEPQINYAKLAHEANVFGEKAGERAGPSIWERYVNTIYGGQTLRPNSWLGKIYNGVESFYDTQMRALYNKYVENFSRAPGGAGGPKKLTQVLHDDTAKELKKLQDELTFDPFGDTTKYMRDTYREVIPPKLRGSLAQANAITAALTFRMFDIGTGLMNLGSLATTAAPVMRSVKRLPTETFDEWVSRTGAWGTRLSETDAVFSWPKALSSATHYVFSKDSNAMFKRASEMGYFTPEAIAMHEAFIAPVESINAAKFNKFLDAASWFADSSERWSRKLAFGLGYKVAKDLHKMDNEADAFMFAHKMMTEMIGDYRATNRPQMFQGSLGIPLGLFQTYMLNYYRRLYSYIERKDYRTLAVQYAMQSSIYGSQTVPGFDVYASAFASNYDGTSNPIDNMRQVYGEDMGDLFFYGTLSNIPKFFGADDGIAFYTRGDTNLMAPPTAATIQTAPVFRAAQSAVQGMRATVDMFRSGGQYSNQQMMEILSHYSLNRTIKNSFEIAAGEKTDRAGRLVEEDTRDWLGITARLLGSTRMTTQKLQETYYRQAGTEQSHRSMRERMTQSFRAKVREGDLSVSDLQDMLRSYLESGGNPQYFASWLRSNLLAAQISKFDKKYAELLNSKKGQEFMRFMSIIQPELTDNGD